ncbi:MAG: SDR family NAD(P)-dependent oxidoreductase [Desulfobacteraceae bacterium]|nr:SDR family NAD(P)-dependent oxidoreductase [Desulfobacteraceae bacterium]
MKQNTPIAVIGMSCIFSKSPSLKEYWRLLFHGEDAITDIPGTHWSPGDYFNEDQKKPDHVYCKRGGFISPVSFDPSEFGIPPSSLEATDTSQLMGLVAAKMALEDAGMGQGKDFDRERTSVILGATGTQELVIPLSSRLGHPIWRRALKDSGIEPEKAEKVVRQISDSYVSWQENSFPGLLGNVVAGRICNRLDLGGTNCVVDAACASSMGAFHLALMELETGMSDMVVSGGVDMLNDIFMHMCFSKTFTLSPTGDARPFSKDADGTVLGEGIGMVVLKRLEDAEKDGDRIYAVIKGMGTSSDGKSQSIYAPNSDGQVKALCMAYNRAGIAPSTVEVMEAHGTGTRVGDKVEFQTIKSVFSESDSEVSKTSEVYGIQCALGSVKSMIGHTKAAAGAAGLIKIVLSLYHKVFLPTIKADEPDPDLNIDDTPFYLNTETRPWFSRKGHPRRAASSSFGFGGSNFHIVAEEYQAEKQEVAWDGSVQISEYLKEKAEKPPGKIAFIFPGQGSQYVSMARDLVCSFPEAFEVMEKANSSWHLAHSSWEQPTANSQQLRAKSLLSDFIYPYPARTKEKKATQEEILRNTDIAQPAIGAVSAAMLKILERFGLRPDATCGHSYGELPALYAAGWIDIDTFLHLSVARGWFMASAGRDKDRDPGTMMAVKAPLEELDALIKDEGLDVILANRNSPNQGVLSGSTEAIAIAEKACKQKKFRPIRLSVAAAFHSVLVKDAQEPFMETLKKIDIAPSNIPVYSNTTGNAYPADPGEARQILGGQILCPVHFVSEIESLFDLGVRTFLEVGPKSVLTGLVKAILKGRDFHAVSLDSSSGKKFGTEDLAKTLCELAALGYPVELDKWESPPEKREQRMSILISGANHRSETKKQKSGSGSSSNGSNGSNGSNSPNGQNSPGGSNGGSSKTETSGQKAGAYRQKQALHEEKTQGKGTMQLNNKKKPEIGCREPGISCLSSAPPLVREKQHIVENRENMNINNQKQFIEPYLHRRGTEQFQVQEPVSGQRYVATDALKVVQDGLKSMQALQTQTTEAHKKFLETQTEASRTLRQMMESTQHLAEVSMGLKAPVYSNTQHLNSGTHETSPEPAVKVDSYTMPIPEISQAPSSPTVQAPDFPETDIEHKDTPKAEPVKDSIENTDTSHFSLLTSQLLNVVSELTGYPVEMLSPDMDIEADLGIDSIKRVEILSAMEEKMPGLPPVSPEIMGTLKTLGQIAEYLGESTEQQPTANSQQPTANNQVSSQLLDVVSELTGYPVEMLSPDMDIEADLGIDSIKRVEILSAMEEKMPGLPPVSPEIMGTLKTLGQIAEYLGESTEPADLRGFQNPVGLKPASIQQSVSRRVVSIAEEPFKQGETVSIPPGRTIFVTDDKAGLGQAIVDEFISIRTDAMLVSLEALENKKDLPPAAGLVILPTLEHETHSDSGFKFQVSSFRITHNIAPELLDSAEKGGAVFATISSLDGAFGLKGKGMANPLQGGLAGLAKTAAIEWKNVWCHAIDIAPDWKENKEIAKAVVAELVTPGPVEIGLEPGLRFTLALESLPYPQGKINLSQGDVVVVTGGARGVTASAAYALAEHVQPTLVLIGRSPEPSPEPRWLVPLEDEGAVKKAILENEFSGNNASPVQLEKRFKKLMANREISNNLEKLRSTGATVLYCSADICDFNSVKSVLNDVRMIHGPVKGIIHGAGILEDRLIIDKTPEQFERVFNTKVRGLNVLLEATKHDDLNYIVLFSSVAARMGNKGQADYAVANEVLNKIAQQESVNRPDCKVLSINWGPWEGGMVTPTLKREFTRNGVGLIPLDAGAASMVQEMMGDKSCPVEVVIGAEIAPKSAQLVSQLPKANSQQPTANSQQLSLTFKKEIDINTYPILESHVLDGKPVVPFALITEWLGHGALHENPGLVLHGLDDIRILKGIKLDKEKKLIRLMAGKARKKGSVFEVDVEVRDGFGENMEVVHSRAKAILAETLSQPSLFHMPDDLKANPYTKTMDEVYEQILFHGFELQGIKEIIGLSSRSMAARLSPAPLPEKWMTEPLRSRWIGDPLVLDSAFQMAIIWCYENTGLASLPSYSASYRQYCNRFPSEGVTAILEVSEVTARKMKGDFTFIDSGNMIVARLDGYECVMNTSLSRAFNKPQQSSQVFYQGISA